LQSKKIRRIALAEPACPLGGYSQSYLQSAGLYKAVSPKILHVDNSRAVLSAVAAETADAGVAFSSDAARSDQCQTWFQIPQSQAAAQYVAGIIRGSRQTKAAQTLLDFIASPVAAKSFRRLGLLPAKILTPAHQSHKRWKTYGVAFGCVLKKSQITCVALMSRQTRPIRNCGKYCGPPGQVCPPPSILYSTTSVPPCPLP